MPMNRQVTAAVPERDPFLDVAKGVAILLVLVGHAVQTWCRDFDDNAVFRFIYSFHMPLFVFLAGGAAAHWVTAGDAAATWPSVWAVVFRRVSRAATGLIVPFLAWTLIRYAILHRGEPLGEYMWAVYQDPAISLWFLPCIFWCTVYTALYMPVRLALRRGILIQGGFKPLGGLRYNVLLMAPLYIAWTALKVHAPTSMGLDQANTFHGGLFAFFLFGIVFMGAWREVTSMWVKWVPVVVFLMLVFFWHRTAPDNLDALGSQIIRGNWGVRHYAFIVAVSGVLTAVNLITWLNARGGMLARVLAYLGACSLAIYALHYHFLMVWPPFVAALILSLLLHRMLIQVPALNQLLFGGRA